jgi:uncharacterized protein (TIGR00369 family)
MRKIKNPWLHKDGYDCFGCSPDNPIGLHMEFFEDGDDIISFWRPQEHYQGWVGTMHGGILATLIDETAGWVVTRKLQTAGMTTKLDVHYKHPVMTSDGQITVRAHIVEQKRNMVFISATLSNAEEVVCVEADAVYYAMDEGRAHEMGFTHCGVEDEQLLSM